MKNTGSDTAKKKIIWKSIEDLKKNPANARTHSEKQVKKLAASIEKFGFIGTISISDDDLIWAGHGRLAAVEHLGGKKIPCEDISHLSDADKKAYMLADNQIANEAGWDADILKISLQELIDDDYDLSFTGFDDDDIDSLFAKPSKDTGSAGSLANKFLVPPFSVLNARDGVWKERKNAWLSKGIQSEVGRGENLLQMSDACNNGGYGEKAKGKAKAFNTTGWIKEKNLSGLGSDVATGHGTSIFDPVLCELAYSWFSPLQGTIIDPFAGGSVRGIVASLLGRKYIGVDLRPEQVEANIDQGNKICEKKNQPIWHCGDSRDIDQHCKGASADMIFSCPPYADLEVYSDDPKDLSTLEYEAFKDAYFEIIKKSCEFLKDDRFACFVVGEVRGKNGNYYDFVGDTIQAFRDAGLEYYNEMILVTSAGSLPIRAGKQFSSSRKIGKTHQNVLVFVKGDGKKAAENCGEVKVHVPEDLG